MLVRLAFSVMIQADADILLIDEVLAVGDAAFQQKCADAFHEMKAAGKTIVLVTHEMATVEQYCHRAMLIDDGKIQHIGDPDEVGRHYLRLNFERGRRAGALDGGEGSGDEVRLLDAWIEDADGERLTNVEQGDAAPAAGRARGIVRDLAGLGVGFILANADGVDVFAVRRRRSSGRRPGGPGRRASGSPSAPSSRTCSSPAATSSTAGSAATQRRRRPLRPQRPRLRRLRRRASTRAASSRCRTRSRPRSSTSGSAR